MLLINCWTQLLDYSWVFDYYYEDGYIKVILEIPICIPINKCKITYNGCFKTITNKGNLEMVMNHRITFKPWLPLACNEQTSTLYTTSKKKLKYIWAYNNGGFQIWRVSFHTQTSLTEEMCPHLMRENHCILQSLWSTTDQATSKPSTSRFSSDLTYQHTWSWSII